MSEAAFWWVHTGSIATRTGSNSYGDTYAPPVDVQCWVEGEQKLITDSKGDQVTSMTVVRGPLADKAKFAVGSRFTYAGDTHKVISLAWFDSGSLDVGLDHYEARLD